MYNYKYTCIIIIIIIKVWPIIIAQPNIGQ